MLVPVLMMLALMMSVVVGGSSGLAALVGWLLLRVRVGGPAAVAAAAAAAAAAAGGGAAAAAAVVGCAGSFCAAGAAAAVGRRPEVDAPAPLPVRPEAGAGLVSAASLVPGSNTKAEDVHCEIGAGVVSGMCMSTYLPEAETTRQQQAVGLEGQVQRLVY